MTMMSAVTMSNDVTCITTSKTLVILQFHPLLMMRYQQISKTQNLVFQITFSIKANLDDQDRHPLFCGSNPHA